MALLAWAAQAASVWAQQNNENPNDDDGEAIYAHFAEELKDGPVTADVGSGSVCSSPVTVDFEGLSEGTTLTNQIGGLTFSTDQPHGVMIFDSSCTGSPSPGGCSGDDDDLGTRNEDFGGEGIGSGGEAGSGGPNTTNLGNILIISEDGDANDPDDNASGGKITVTFDNPVRLHSVDMVDMDDGSDSAMLKAFNGGTQVGSTKNVGAAGNNSFQSVSFDRSNVTRLEIILASSGAVGAIRYCQADLQCESNANRIDGTWGYTNETDGSRSCPSNVPAATCSESIFGDILRFDLPIVKNTGPSSASGTVSFYFSEDLEFVSAPGGSLVSAAGPGSLGEIAYDFTGLTAGNTLNVTARLKNVNNTANSRVVVNLLTDITVANSPDVDSNPANLVVNGIASGPIEDDNCGLTAVLPVELVAFEALLDGRNATLLWETASETVNAGFEVQHRYASEADKAAGARFEVLGFVEGAGTTLEAQRYRFQVADLQPGRHVFRLRQIDFDGSFEYSPQIEVAVEMPEAYLVSKVYPNPFNPEASLSFGVRQAQDVRVELFNMLGQRVKVLYAGRPAAGSTKIVAIDGSGLQSGVYLLRVLGETFVDTQTVTLVK